MIQTESNKVSGPSRLYAVIGLVLTGLCLMVLFGFVAHGLTDGFNNRGFATYKNSRFNFSFLYPIKAPLKELPGYSSNDKSVRISEDWEKSSKNFNSLDYTEGGGVNDVSADFELIDQEFRLDKSKEEYFAREKKYITDYIVEDNAETDTDRTRIVGEFQEITVSGKPALRYTVETVLLRTPSYRVVLKVYDQAYRFQLDISYDNYDESSDQIQKIIESIKLP